ncbi:MAG: hypothetical protein ACYS5W_13860, partial [Planctomycetota bacterium]
MKTTSLCLTTAVLLAASLHAQTFKVIPPSYTNLEGNSTHTYPYGRQTTEQQILINGSMISKATALIRGLNVRPNQTDKGYPAYQKKYTLTVVSPRRVWPAPFVTKWPFKTVYTFPASTSNFLAHIKTNDLTTPPTSPARWAQDAISLRDTSLAGEKAKVGTRCTLGNGNYLGITVGTKHYVGGQVSITLKLAGGAPAGTWPTAILGLGATVKKPGFPIDLGAAGMPNCFLLVDPLLAYFYKESGGTYPAFSPNVPNDNKLFGAVFFAQGLGATKNGLVGGVV